jgi:hypothetical protein
VSEAWRCCQTSQFREDRQQLKQKRSEGVNLENSRRMQEMELNGQVGETAGRIWHLLNDEGPHSVSQLKKKLNGSGELVNFALGWLAREDKVDITQQKRVFTVALK